MTWQLMFVIAIVTYGSRAAALALPPMPAAFSIILDRMPSPLFAGLAAQALITPAGGLAGSQVLAAAAGAVIAAPLRSLPLCLVAGVGAYAVAGMMG